MLTAQGLHAYGEAAAELPPPQQGQQSSQSRAAWPALCAKMRTKSVCLSCSHKPLERTICSSAQWPSSLERFSYGLSKCLLLLVEYKAYTCIILVLLFFFFPQLLFIQWCCILVFLLFFYLLTGQSWFSPFRSCCFDLLQFLYLASWLLPNGPRWFWKALHKSGHSSTPAKALPRLPTAGGLIHQPYGASTPNAAQA